MATQWVINLLYLRISKLTLVFHFHICKWSFLHTIDEHFELYRYRGESTFRPGVSWEYNFIKKLVTNFTSSLFVYLINTDKKKKKTEQNKETNEKPYMFQTRIDTNRRIKFWFRYSKEMYLLWPLIVCALHLMKLQIYHNERWKSLKFLSQSHGVPQIANTELQIVIWLDSSKKMATDH